MSTDDTRSRATLVALPDNRIMAAEIELDRRIRPPPHEELELVFDGAAIADEHKPAFLLQELLRWLLDTDKWSAEAAAIANFQNAGTSCRRRRHTRYEPRAG